jgi:hypothetical protein
MDTTTQRRFEFSNYSQLQQLTAGRRLFVRMSNNFYVRVSRKDFREMADQVKKYCDVFAGYLTLSPSGQSCTIVVTTRIQ